MGLTLKKVVRKRGFEEIYKEIMLLLKEAQADEGIEVKEAVEYFRIPSNKTKEFKEGLKAWHLDIITGAPEEGGRGRGKDIIIYKAPEPKPEPQPKAKKK